MKPKTTIALLLLVVGGLAALAVRGNAVLGGETPAADLAAEATAAAGKEGAEAAKPDPAAVARAKKMEKVKKLGCFQCHNFEHYLNGRPKQAKPPGGPALAEPPAGACGAPGHECKAPPPAAVAAAEKSEQAPANPAKNGEAAKVGAADKDADGDEEAGKAAKEEGKDGEETGEEKEEEDEEEEEAPPNPKDFAHGPHEEEGVGHCHQCHAMEGHFQVKVRMQACAECH